MDYLIQFNNIESEETKQFEMCNIKIELSSIKYYYKYNIRPMRRLCTFNRFFIFDICSISIIKSDNIHL